VSTLWTPGGEVPVGGRPPPAAPPPPGPPAGAASPRTGADPAGGPREQELDEQELGEQELGEHELSEQEQAELAAQMAELQERLAATPAAVVVANHCFGLFELAALHLSRQPPNLAEAQVAIDALGAVVDGLGGRLGEAADQLAGGLAQLRLAFVQLRSA